MIGNVSGFVGLVLVLVFGYSCTTDVDEEVVYHRSTVWAVGENGADGYRIPGIVVSGSGTLLAFSEERPLYGDADPKSLVVKRSRDRGISWSDNIYIEISNGEYWRENRDAVHPDDDPIKKEVWTNIAPIVDRETNRIFFFYALSEGKIKDQNLQRYTRVYYKYSDDDGISWSGRKEVTTLLNANENGQPNKDSDGKWMTDENGFPCDYLGRAFHMPGPGHGIQLEDGRLLLQVWNRKALGILDQGEIPVEDRVYGVSTIYSDDHGESWHFGSAFGQELNINESRMVQLENGDIYMNARYVPTIPGERNNHRVTAISTDGGVSWGNMQIDEDFPASNHCDAGLAKVVISEGKDLLLYSKNESVDGRKNLVVRLSQDQGQSWNISKVLDEGPAGYSDIAVTEDGTVHILYETGKNSPVYCTSFDLNWLLN